MTGHNGPVTAVAISGSSERQVVVTASEDRTVRVWDLVSSAPLLDPMPIPGTVRASFAMYNTKEEVDELIKGVRKAIKMLK